MEWEGTVSGILISGTSTLKQEGKAPVIYWFKGKTSMEMPKANMPETPKVNTPDMPKADMPEAPKY